MQAQILHKQHFPQLYLCHKTLDSIASSPNGRAVCNPKNYQKVLVKNFEVHHLNFQKCTTEIK